MATILLKCFLIFASRILDVSMMATRTILLTKGKSKLAAGIGFFEVIVYMNVLGIVVNDLDKPAYLVAYALGFSTGLIVGTKLEDKLAFGDVTIRIIIHKSYNEIIDILREKGYGVTVVVGEGRDGERNILYVTARRKSIKEVKSLLEAYNISAFVSVMDVRDIKGGTMKKAQMMFKKK
ncbi:DUF2179 domain-containing protein [Sporosalibacterium faouarense]|uniref:DUF2179 domain-containing protein n=1 Tax=Sporosalibacterium faouarense TaxID=516123 RepID=UPI00192B78AB|nr:DUF2179 domain-containing protein [Sporosalibacterium faouarense]